jgi:hypothetical protein
VFLELGLERRALPLLLSLFGMSIKVALLLWDALFEYSTAAQLCQPGTAPALVHRVARLGVLTSSLAQPCAPNVTGGVHGFQCVARASATPESVLARDFVPDASKLRTLLAGYTPRDIPMLPQSRCFVVMISNPLERPAHPKDHNGSPLINARDAIENRCKANCTRPLLIRPSLIKGTPSTSSLVLFQGQALITHLQNPLALEIDAPTHLRPRLLPHRRAKPHVD